MQSAPRRLQVQPHLPPACHPDREAPLVAVPRLALPPEPACLAGRTVVLSARGLRRPAAEARACGSWRRRRGRCGEPVAEAQGVRQLAAEAQGVRQLAAEAQGVRQLAAEAQGVRQLAAEAQGVRQLAAEAQGVRQLAAEAQGVRQLVAEAQGVRQLAAEAQGVRQLAAEARALQRAAQAWQAWPAQASAYLFRAGLARPRSPTPIPRAPAEPTTPESE